MNLEKFTSKSEEMHLIRNDNMHCKDCDFAYENSDIECVKYKQKPLGVIIGGKCPDFNKKK